MRQQNEGGLVLQSSSSAILSQVTHMSSKASDVVDEVLHTSYLRVQGHSGAVTCVDGSDGMDYVVTGGVDSTARVWEYDANNFASYRLKHILSHGSPDATTVVTSVAFHGSDGPVVTVTNHGDLLIWCLKTLERTVYRKEIEAIIDISTKRGRLDHVLLGYAVGKKAKLTAAEPDDRSPGKYSFQELCSADHERPVIHVDHVPGSIHEGAALVTCMQDCDCIMLWNLSGDLVERLRSSGDAVTCFTISRLKDTGTGWIMSGGGSWVSLWPFRDGSIISKDNVPVDELSSPAPLVEYSIAEGVAGVAIDPDSKFIVVTFMDAETVVTSIRPKRLEDAMDVKEPANALVKCGLEEPLITIPHRFRATQTCVYRDDDENDAVLIVGLENGACHLWDLEGRDSGELSSDLRSLSFWETLRPILLLVVYFFQYIGFAFGPATSWEEELETPMKITKAVVFFDVHLVLEIDKEQIFWPEMYAIGGIMLAFILNAVSGIVEMLKKSLARVRRSEAYRREQDAGGQLLCESLAKALLRALLIFTMLFMELCSTVLVVPMFKQIYSYFDCVHPLDGSEPFLSSNPHIICYESEHLWLICVFGVMTPCFVLLLIPYAVVAGDVNYVKRSNLCSLTQWINHAVRKVTLNDQGALHPSRHSIFVHHILDLGSKLILPFISIMATSMPLLQTISISCVGCFMFIVSMVYPPFVNNIWNSIVQGSKLFTFCAMVCGIITVVFPDQLRISTLSLGSSFLFALLFMWLRVSFSNKTNSNLTDTAYSQMSAVTSEAL